MTINADSRLNRSAALTVIDSGGEARGPAFVDVVPRFTDVERRSNRTYRVRESDDWHRLSHRFYGRGQDFWALLDFNEVVDPFTELVPGRSIVVPSNDTVQFDIKDFGGLDVVEEQPE